MDSCLHLTADLPRRDRPSGWEKDVSFSPALVEAFLAEYTDPGDLVFDPFAGFGTTLIVAEAMNRRALGTELLAERVDFVHTRIGPAAEIVQHDARDLAALDVGPFDLVITSPPYMTRTHHPQNPLTGYQSLDGEYETYLAELQTMSSHVGTMVRPGKRIVVNVANLAAARDRIHPVGVGRRLGTQ